MVYGIDDENKPGKAVRTLLYDEAGELTGATISTANFGTVECESGSVAFKAGFADMKQLGSNGTWKDC